MKLPIIAYGHPILKQKCITVDKNTPEITQFIHDLWETMEAANGCGLSASQTGKTLQLFIADSKIVYDHMDSEDQITYFEKQDHGVRETFINATIIKQSDTLWEDSEGCLSIPGLSQKVKRPWKITVEYLNIDFEKQIRTFAGLTARIIQHEYDHTRGVLYLDHLKPLTKKIMESKLKQISKGKVSVGYPMKFL